MHHLLLELVWAGVIGRSSFHKIFNRILHFLLPIYIYLQSFLSATSPRPIPHSGRRADGFFPSRPPPVSLSILHTNLLVQPCNILFIFGMGDFEAKAKMGSPSLSSSSSSSSLHESESEELQHMPLAPLPIWKNKKRLSKQLSMCETRRDIAWERRRRQILNQERRRNGINVVDSDDLTDEDLHELKGCIELGFGFNEEEGQQLCSTLPALDLYFAVNRQLSPSPVSTPGSTASLGARSSSFGSPMFESDWKICSPRDDPQQVKTKLRHWAQAVACSVMQSY
ncbi:uncharacterized protein LOC8269080 isoform X2 [Ricinus communis]|uniref:uncharacterized protein LOC8269080 isoform X2 n=1 Tax=Ricinus communis TaxID=3988 RepID=UPI00201B2D5C|nr:uncharacterized protein LOC8269080 isoform X2 [Ricinus communis]